MPLYSTPGHSHITSSCSWLTMLSVRNMFCLFILAMHCTHPPLQYQKTCYNSRSYKWFYFVNTAKCTVKADMLLYKSSPFKPDYLISGFSLQVWHKLRYNFSHTMKVCPLSSDLLTYNHVTYHKPQTRKVVKETRHVYPFRAAVILVNSKGLKHLRQVNMGS